MSKDKAEILNAQFQSVFTKDTVDSTTTLPGPQFPPIGELHISKEGVEKLLKDINPNKASGPDEIPCRLLKGLATELAPCLTALFNQSIETACLPKDWLNANIAPVFKKGSRSMAVNYRPVSLTSVICKILEHIITKHIRNHLDKHNILSPYQHGFRYKHSCESQLLITTHDLMKHQDKKHQVDVAVLDFSKAFDTVPHLLLLGKLRHYGIRGPILQWIDTFLRQRHQRVVVEGQSSSSVRVESGVPQGTVLGPLLFLLHINDLPENVTSSVILFADEFLLYRTIKSIEDHLALQKDLENLVEWGSRWGMKFNTDKCHILRISRSKTPYTMAGNILKQVSSVKYLGITLEETLQWNLQVASTARKANGVLAFVRRNLKGAPRKAKEMTYTTLVRPILEYGAVIWDPHQKQNVHRLEQVQRRAARFVCNSYTKTQSVSALLKQLNWTSLEERRRHQRLILLYKIAEGLVAVPVESINLEPNKGKTRSGGKKTFKHIRTNTTTFQYAYTPRTIPEWNSLSEDTKSAKSTSEFKRLLLNQTYQ